MSDPPAVGFVGIGTMGRPMAANLADAGAIAAMSNASRAGE